MVLTAGAGRIDYSKADSNSSIWIIRENLLLADLERERLVEAAERRHLQHMLSASGWSIWAEEGKLQEQVVESQKQLRKADKLMFPWMQLDDREHYKGFVAQLREEFTARYGDPDDPETKKKIKSTRDSLKRRELEAKQRAEQEKQELADKKSKLRDRRNKLGKAKYAKR